MALINIKFSSEVLGRQTSINVIIPQKRTNGEIGIENAAKDEKYKTLLLLHGLSDDNTIWLRRTSIERYATERGIAVVMPSGDRSFYTDMKYGDKFYTYISQEVLRIAREYLPLSEKREDNFIAGNSMGGYGALKIALKNPESFCAAAGLSSVADVESFMTKYASHLREPIFGTGEKVPDSEDLFFLAKDGESQPIKPRIYMGEGKGDYMYADNIRLKTLFESLDYDYTYSEDEGAHNWAFWDDYIQRVLSWLLD
ncbi:MAG: esterase family protein [Clostridia bacterium]|nr:esterase family protein [Clostridia bacterium]